MDNTPADGEYCANLQPPNDDDHEEVRQALARAHLDDYLTAMRDGVDWVTASDDELVPENRNDRDAAQKLLDGFHVPIKLAQLWNEDCFAGLPPQVTASQPAQTVIINIFKKQVTVRAETLNAAQGPQTITSQDGDSHANLNVAENGSATQDVISEENCFDDLRAKLALAKSELPSASLSKAKRERASQLIARIEDETDSPGPRKGRMRWWFHQLRRLAKTGLTVATSAALEVAMKKALGEI